MDFLFLYELKLEFYYEKAKNKRWSEKFAKKGDY